MHDTAAKIVLAPLLAVQALAVRRRALILPEAAGPRAGQAGAGPALRLLILGDSSAAGVGAATQDEALAGGLVRSLAPHVGLDWRLIARTGATTAATLARLEAEAPARFDVAVIALGVNDVTHLVPRRRFLEQQARLRATLAARFGVRRVVQAGLPPMGDFPALPQPLRWTLGETARRFDAALAAALSAAPGARHVAFGGGLGREMMAADGFHPGPQGYAVWAEALGRAVRDGLADPSDTR